MNKALKFTALTAGLAVTVWIQGSRPVRAVSPPYSCATLDGTPCCLAGSYVDCTSDDSFVFTCTCMNNRGTLTWVCPF